MSAREQVSAFAKDCLTFGPDLTVEVGALKRAYQGWCRERQLRAHQFYVLRQHLAGMTRPAVQREDGNWELRGFALRDAG